MRYPGTIGVRHSPNVALRSQGIPDPSFASVVLLTGQENGADGSTTFTDSSSAARALTAVGNVQWDTAQSYTGTTSSILFDGTGDAVQALDSADWNFAAGDFTMEGFIRWNAKSGIDTVFAQWIPNSARTFLWGLNGTAWTFFYTTNGSTIANVNVSWTPSLATWYHVAACRSGNTLRFFVDGNQQGADQAFAVTLFDGTGELEIGRAGSDGHGFDGWMNGMRITKGVARYTTAFTPPTLPLPTF